MNEKAKRNENRIAQTQKNRERMERTRRQQVLKKTCETKERLEVI